VSAHQAGAFASAQFPVIIRYKEKNVLLALGTGGLIFGGVACQRENRNGGRLWGESVAGMNTQLAGQHWFVLLNGKRHGPFPFSALTKAAKQGVITAETNVWRRGWQKWHPARQVPGLLNEAPLAPDDAEWTDERLASPTEEALLYAPRRAGARPAPDVVTLRGGPPSSEDPTEHIFADEWRMLAERPAQDRKIGMSSRFGRKRTPKTTDFDGAGRDVAVVRPAARTETADNTPPAGRGRRLYKRAAGGLLAILLLCAGWVLLGPGSLRQSTDTKSIKTTSAAAGSALMASVDNLPATVASLPAVVALQRNDPVAFERFKRRYADSAQNARDDEVMSLARSALRKSVKHLLAISSGDVLLEITETSLAYMQGMQASNPESCVALSDESKGAKLTSNLAKELPVEFVRDMSVLERIASTNPHTAVAPMPAEEARPLLETVFNALRTQSVKVELLGRPKLEPADFAPYCALVIAFYKAVLDLPRDDKINLLRYLYAAAANADSDLASK
jgi:GYF domain 2